MIGNSFFFVRGNFQIYPTEIEREIDFSVGENDCPIECDLMWNSVARERIFLKKSPEIPKWV